MFSILLLIACREDSKEPAPEGWEGVEVSLDPFTLRLDSAFLPEGGLRLGRVSAYDPSFNYDPWNLYDPELDWAVPTIRWDAAETAAWDGDRLQLTLESGDEAWLAREERAEGLGLRVWMGEDGVEPAAGEAAAPYVSVSLESSDGEPLYGLGECFDAVNQRGRVKAMQIELDLDLESSYNEAHVPVPWIFGADGWGLGLLSDEPAVLDAASEDEERVTAVVNAPAGLSFLLLSSEEPAELPAMWSRATALPRLPPTWAFAPMLWRNVNESGDQVLEDAAAIREEDLAFGVMWIDNPWQTSYNSMAPDPDKFSDWDGMVETLHANGFRWLAWTTPYLEEEDLDFDAYAEDGLFVDLAIPLNDFGELVDLTGEEAQDRWQARAAAAAGIGIQGWKLDYGEDIQLGYGETRFQTSFDGGGDERTWHHRFVEAYHGAYAAPYTDGDRFLLGRAGAWGSGAITDCIWPGDLDSGFWTHGEDGHVGGLPAAIRAGQSLALSGFPCFASDTGGYRHDRADQETIIRWTEFSALLPFMQVGGGSDHNYWLLEGDWTEAVPEAGRRYTQLHTRLFPYFQALMVEASEQGTPPLLPAALKGADPEHATAETTFLVGPHLLVSAVDQRDVRTWEVSLPPGGWVDWWTGERVSGEVTLDAPLGQGPLLLGEGAIVPLLRESVRTLAPSSAGVDSWADDPGALVLRVVPGEGSFAVIDGPALTLTADALEIGALGIYTGMSVEIWDEDGAISGLTLDGETIEFEREGAWVVAEAGEGTLRFSADPR